MVRRQRLVKIIYAWIAMAISRTFAFSCEIKIQYKKSACSSYRNRHRRSVILGAGRLRRISSPDQQKLKQQQNQQQQKLIDNEESVRRKRLHQMEQRFQKASRQEDRILFLETKLANELDAKKSSEDMNDDSLFITDAERAELKGLLRVRDNYEEQYDPREFSEDHLEFKALHNDVFARLVRWCEKERDRALLEAGKQTIDNITLTRVFFLDGPDGGTASSLIHKANFDPSQCYVANRHETTCSVLKISGGGLLPEENVAHATSSEALTKAAAHDGAKPEKSQGAFANLHFTGFYFDGCAGYVPHIVNMMSSALLVLEDDLSDGAYEQSKYPIAIGYSVLGGNKNVVEKELEISRALTVIARSRGMRVVHALDDPSRFGLPPDVPKLGGHCGNTFTTWLILLEENQ